MADITNIVKGQTDWHLPINSNFESLNNQKSEIDHAHDLSGESLTGTLPVDKVAVENNATFLSQDGQTPITVAYNTQVRTVDVVFPIPYSQAPNKYGITLISANPAGVSVSMTVTATGATLAVGLNAAAASSRTFDVRWWAEGNR